MIAHRLAKCSSGPLALNLRVAKHGGCLAVQRREIHDSSIPSGRGGRSSFSGIVATVFGGTGFIGHIFTNRLARIGSSIMLPHRASYQHIQRLKVMSDLGQMMFRDFRLQNDDDHVRELIRYSNCVVNLIGSNIPYNHYSVKQVNLDWPLRLASLVAEKNDGTRLLHLTNLNCHLARGREVSRLLDFDHRAEVGMREIYPETIIARSANVFGMMDTYTNFLLHPRFKDLAPLGGLPLLYDNGKSTLTQPIYVGDLAEALTRILRHLDAPGQTFELVGPNRYLLKDFVEYLYSLTGADCYLYDVLGPMDESKANMVQKGLRKAIDYYFHRQKQARMFRPWPRFIDMMSRRETTREQWTSKDYYNQIHLNDTRTGAPGLEELGIEPTCFEDKAYFIHGKHYSFVHYKVPTEENFPPMRQHPTNVPRIRDR